jgi:hypothetical protein
MNRSMKPPSQVPSATPPAPVPSATPLCRAALALYPPSWRARYADEVRAMLDDSGASPAAIASLACHALPAWVRSSRHLYDGPARMRASLASVLMAGSMVIGLGLVFAQLTQAQGFRPGQHPVIGWCYAVFDVAFTLSLLVAAAGGLPLWFLMLRRARREVRPRDVAYLLLPVIASVVYLAALIGTLKLVGGPGGVGPWWFLAIAAAGFVAAAIAAAGPGAALRRLQPRGPALRLATTAAALAAGIMGVAVAAIAAAVIGLCLWARGFAGYHDATLPGVYLVLLAAATAVTVTSATRGTRAARR